jgi:hypothetical protein
MQELSMKPRALWLVLFVLLASPFNSGALGQGRSVSGGGEVDELRNRVLELEAQNETILQQLAQIQDLLKQTVRVEGSEDSDVQVATTGPVPVGLVAPALPSLPLTSRLSPRLPSGPEPQVSEAPIVRAEGNDSEIGFYGFVRIDAIFDDSRASAFQTPTYIRSEATGTDSQSNFTIHPRLSRVGMNFRAPNALESLGDARLTGKIEADFQNGGRESRAVPRMRHAYLQLDWNQHSLLAGQTSDLISPLFPSVNGDTMMWNAGNLGDRRMQVRYGYESESGLTFRAGVGMTGAVDPLDADSNGILDGEAATTPNIQGRVGYDSSKFSVGAWSHYARLHTDAFFGSQNDFNGYSYGTDFDFRLTPRVNVRGEAWAGSNLGDMRGGIGQSFNQTTGREIDSRGGWVELGLQSGRHGLFTGYTMDDPKNAHLDAGARTENRAWYVTNRFNLSEPLTLGIDYLHWRTQFKGSPQGTDNRINLYLIYGF